MTDDHRFEVIIIGGSYAGLAAGMALGRALRRVLILDSGVPCNRQTPYSHNFLTRDGVPPAEIAAIAREQVARYDIVTFRNGQAVKGTQKEEGFELQAEDGELFQARKLIFAAGIRDQLPGTPGLADCWGISVLHCPYCHGYEVRHRKTGILANGNEGFEYAAMIAQWTGDLTLYTNGPSTLTGEQTALLQRHRITVDETPVEALEHQSGQLEGIRLGDGRLAPVEALYTRPPFRQHSDIPASLGCGLTEEGYLQADGFQRTSIPGVFACGDSTSKMRTVANAVATGTVAGMAVNKELIMEAFLS